MTTTVTRRADPPAPPQAAPATKHSRIHLSENGPALRHGSVPYWLILPVGLFLAVFSLLPFVWAVLISLQPPLLASSGQITSFSLRNFENVLTDPATLKSLVVTIWYAFLSTVLIIAVSVATALALKAVRHGAGAYQLVLIIPLTLAPPVVVILWQALFDPSSGAVDGIFKQIGLPNQGFYESTHQALYVLVAMAVWSNAGFGPSSSCLPSVLSAPRCSRRPPSTAPGRSAPSGRSPCPS
ncbi:hypothetical protein GCM10025867_36900 [Frondihabitans sucicola]|uniref:Sugar ABC transporter permease n=1 Tax=Frondihabitans sucicola TaxID=1268041 RepID=A0ABN6Y285_9MICO|nr:sugar ABC transporter permease [Frondihabitans sucicola]BDZ51449.1 hypothetical protein GCM10025867_36900 [Frondihabitans sucicola]